ncbi:cytochrome b [Robbsia sp. Bb-Pol-6]|uniref:Cytochrome b n=1 Tax=Robbsia betulipollinis TaxID=2981849 RepID=A0ABT3ZI93_9BURK|nr:cytochrome b [Robbsia betulipollinis]MCY0386244.1 cytochrome b [Robbsia betulipollinis]
MNYSSPRAPRDPRSPLFPKPSRILHWLMAVLILAMLFIGVGMVASVSYRYNLLVSVHKPIGIAILILVILRIVNRRINPPPPLPADLPSIQKLAAHASHLLLYALMLAQPLVGWGMLSAGGLPITLFGGVQLPPILPQNPMLFARLRELHTVFAYLLFATIVVHIAAALFHGLIRRDGVLESMTGGRAK